MQAGILVTFLISLSIKVLAYEIERRADSPLCCIGSCPDDDDDNQATTLDGPMTSANSAGFGAEFETGDVQFQSYQTCTKPNIDISKGKLIDSRQGPNWMLTAETTSSPSGYLVPEYILDGTKIKIGSGDAAKAAAAVAKDIVMFDLMLQCSNLLTVCSID